MCVKKELSRHVPTGSNTKVGEQEGLWRNLSVHSNKYLPELFQCEDFNFYLFLSYFLDLIEIFSIRKYENLAVVWSFALPETDLFQSSI